MSIRQHFRCASLLALGAFAASTIVPARAQPAGANQWTWMGGSDTIGDVCTQTYFCGQPGVYGTLGTPSETNAPGGRYSGVSWTDSIGRLWLFGGAGFDSQGTNFFLNDLWRFDPSSNEWTWVGGSDIVNQSGVYGTPGVPAASNIPGGRSVAASWTDKNGNFWLFGGWGMDANGEYAALSDLWRFTPSTGQWTWESGNTAIGQPGVFGTLGSSSPANKPGGTYEASSWIDSTGHLWLFGGYDEDINSVLDMGNDLWQFDPSAGEWTWMGGSNTPGTACPTGITVYCGFAGVYGTEGAASASNWPGSRNSAVSWTDATGRFWLAFGVGYDGSGHFGQLNDVWMYDLSSHEWTWMGGSNSVGSGAGYPGIYGTLGILSTENLPGSGAYGSTFVDPAGNLWLFNGGGMDSRGLPGLLNDVWEFVPSLNEWAWMAGSNTVGPSENRDGHAGWPGVYGTLGTPSAANTPGGRESAMNWVDNDGNFWLFGGSGFDSIHDWGELNDLWKYQPVAAATPDFSVSATPDSVTVAAGESGTVSISIAPLDGFSALVSFSCSGLPAGVSCSFSPTTVTPASSGASTSLLIQTSASAASAPRRGSPYLPAAAPAILCVLLLKRKRPSALLALLLAFLAIVPLTACGRVNSISPVQQSTTSTFAVTAASGSLAHSTSITLTVN